jgi:head-tail adaptor
LKVPRHRVLIERRTETKNSVGEVLVEFETAATIWAERHDGFFTSRYFGECMPGWRLKFGTEVYEIVGVIDLVGKTRLVKLVTKEIRAGSEMYPAAGRWTAKQGFLPGRLNSGNSEEFTP